MENNRIYVEVREIDGEPILKVVDKEAFPQQALDKKSPIRYAGDVDGCEVNIVFPDIPVEKHWSLYKEDCEFDLAFPEKCMTDFALRMTTKLRELVGKHS